MALYSLIFLAVLIPASLLVSWGGELYYRQLLDTGLLHEEFFIKEAVGDASNTIKHQQSDKER